MSKSVTLIPWNGWKKVSQLLELTNFPFKAVDTYQKQQNQTISMVGRLTKDYSWNQLLRKSQERSRMGQIEKSIGPKIASATSSDSFCFGPKWLVFSTPSLISQPQDTCDLGQAALCSWSNPSRAWQL